MILYIKYVVPWRKLSAQNSSPKNTFCKFLKGIMVSSCNLAAVFTICPTFLKIWMNDIHNWTYCINICLKTYIRDVQKFIHMDSTTRFCDEHRNENGPWQKYWLTHNFLRKHDERLMWRGNKHSTFNCLFIENYMLTEVLSREVLSSVFITGSCSEICGYKFSDIMYTDMIWKCVQPSMALIYKIYTIWSDVMICS